MTTADILQLEELSGRLLTPEEAAPQLTVEQALEREGLIPSAREISGAIETKFRRMARVHDRMDKDWDLYNLKEFQPDAEESISEEDYYTTNAPRVMAEKIISFISLTEPIIRANSDEAQEAQEEQNDRAEQLAIGMMDNVNRRRRRQGDPSIQDSLAAFTVIRGRYAAVRALLIKDEDGITEEDILPLDPRNLVVQKGHRELKWAAYRMSKEVQEIRDEFPDFRFQDEGAMDEDESVEVFEYYCRKKNPFYDPLSLDPFDKHPDVYMAGTIIDDQWARPLHNLWMLSFPVVLAPVGALPMITPGNGEHAQDVEETFGESIFAENRRIWQQFNRAMSYAQDLMGKASDPPENVYSLDGTKTMDEGSHDKGAQRAFSVANQEDSKLAETPDPANIAVLFLQALQQDAVAGGLPPQAFGLLDKPLSSVALRQLGNNLEHRVSPRMKAVAACMEGAMENLIAQYETGGFEPITVSGRRFDNQRFANRIITPEGIYGHDPVTVRMKLALPEDDAARWSLAQMAMTPTASGEPLGSLEWVRENIIGIESSKQITRQNREAAGVMQDPLASALEQVTAYLRDGNQAMASIWFDRLTVLSMQRQVEGNTMLAQLQAFAQQIGIPLQPPPFDPLNAGMTTGAGSTIDQGLNIGQTAQNTQSRNPANGAMGIAEQRGIGNQPSPEAGFNTTASRQRYTGLVGADGSPLYAEE